MGSIDWAIFGVMVAIIAGLVIPAYVKYYRHARLVAASSDQV